MSCLIICTLKSQRVASVLKYHISWSQKKYCMNLLGWILKWCQGLWEIYWVLLAIGAVTILFRAPTLEHLSGRKNPGSSRAGVSGCKRRLQRQRRNIYVGCPQQANMRRGANILYRKFLLVPCPHHPMLPHFSFLLFFYFIHCTRHPRV